MHRHHLLVLLVVMISVLFISNLFADKANQVKLEAQFKADTGFDGTITWWDCDDTFKELQGRFPDMDVYYDDEEDYISSTMDNILQALLPYTGLTKGDFFKPDISYDSYVYPQMLNQLPIDRNGYIEIDMNDYDLSIYLYTLPRVKAPEKAIITKEEAFKTVRSVSIASDIDSTSYSNMYLTYISTTSDILSPKKPETLSIAWSVKGNTNWYFIDAISGQLINKRSA